MAYDLYDLEDNWVGPGPSTQGLRDLHEWANDKPVIKRFLNDGITEDLPMLIGALGVVRGQGTVESSRQGLLDAAKNATGGLILSDGVGPSEE